LAPKSFKPAHTLYSTIFLIPFTSRAHTLFLFPRKNTQNSPTRPPIPPLSSSSSSAKATKRTQLQILRFTASIFLFSPSIRTLRVHSTSSKTPQASSIAFLNGNTLLIFDFPFSISFKMVRIRTLTSWQSLSVKGFWKFSKSHIEHLSQFREILGPIVAQNQVTLSFPFLFSLILVYVVVLCVRADLRLVCFLIFICWWILFVECLSIGDFTSMLAMFLLFPVGCLSFQS